MLLAASTAAHAAGTVTLDTFDLPPGASITLEFEVDISAAPTTSPGCNQGEVRGDVDSNITTFNTDDPDTGASADPTCTPLQLLADLSITKTDGQASDIPGTSITYTIVASNAGPSTDTNVTVADTFPASLTGCSYTSAVSGAVTGNDPGPTGGNLNDTGISMPAGSSVTYTVTCTIAPNATGTLSNTATITNGTTTDPAPGNNSATDMTTLTPEADLAVTKVDSADPVDAAAAFSYTVSVTNGGPSTATSLTVTDTLPAGVAFVSASGTGWSCGELALVVTCTRPTLAPGAAPVITINVTAPDEGGMISNSVAVDSPVTDPTAGNDSDSETTTITAVADLSVTKTDSADPVDAGSAYSYTVSVNNAGPSTATNVTVTDTLPANTGFVSASGTGWSCGELALVVTCTRPSLAVGAAPAITISVTARPQPGTATNNVMVDATESDPTPGNDSDSEDTTIDAVANIGVTKDDGTPSVTPGGTTTYTITVTNSGPSDDPAVTVVDTFPAFLLNCSTTSVAAGGATGNDAGPTMGNINDGGISMPAGSSVTYTATCDVDSGATGTIDNTATVTGSFDPNNANDSATDSDTVLPLDWGDAPTAAQSGFASSYPTQLALDGARHVATGPLLGVERDIEPNGQPDLIAHGDDFDTTPDDEDGVTFTVVTRSVPVETLIVCEGALATATVELTPPFAPTPEGVPASAFLNLWIDWNRDGDWGDAGEQIADDLAAVDGVNPINFTVPCDAAVGMTYARVRLSSTAGLDVTGQANDGEVEDYPLTIAAEGDLAITKTDGVVTAIPGAGLIYTIVASNAGPSLLAGVSVADTFPAGLTCGWTSTPAGGATGNTNNPGSANLAETLTLPVGASVTYTVGCTIDPAATGTLSNTATIATTLLNTSDPNLANNSATDSDTVLTPQADLQVTKTDGSTTEIPGTPVTYTITLSNAGPSTDPNVTLVDTFAGTLSGCSTTSVAAGGATGNDAGPVAGNLNDTTIMMPPGSSVTYTATCNIAADATGSLANTATATASVTDPTPANNSATDTDTLTPQADVSITKTDGSATEVPGTPVTYTIVVANAGPSTDPNVTVADTFAGTLSGCSTTSVPAGGATGNDPGPTAGNINDAGINMPPGSSVTYTATCNIAPEATGSLANTATATSSVTDPTPANNSATDTDTLQPEADVSITKTDGSTTEVPGTPVTYTITVSNAGPSTDPNVTVADTFAGILSGCSTTSVAAGGATGNDPGPTAGNVNDADVSLPPSASVTYTATCNIDPAATGSLANTATASGSITDTNPGNNSATDTDTLTPETDLEIEKTADLTVVQGGEVLTYTLTVINHGPSNATGVVITDNLPAEVTLTSTTGCVEDPNGIPTCTIGNLAAGVLVAANVVTQVDPAPLPNPSFDNTASVTGNETDPVPANNSDTLTLSTDMTPPEVDAVDTAAGAITGCGPILRATLNAIDVVFSEALMTGGGANAADNAANYRLFGAGPDFDLDNLTCNAPQPGDTAVSIDGVTYQVDTPANPQSTASLALNGGSGLADGMYRLIVCGETGIEDLAGNGLDGDPGNPGADDFVVTFRIDAGNLFANGHMDCATGGSELAPWQPQPPAAPEVTRTSDDSDSSPESGSVLISTANGTGFGVAQCAPVVVVDNPYTMTTRVRVDTTLSAILGFNAQCQFYASGDCTGGTLGSASRGTSLADTAGSWLAWQASPDVTLPVGTGSVRCSFLLDNPLAQPFDVNVDQLRLEGAGLIFADGFESGDTSAWSATVP